MINKEYFEQSLLTFFAPIRPYLDDPSVSEVMINGPFEIFVERKGCIEKTPAQFASREALTAALRNLSQFVGKLISEEHPILEGRFPDGSRVEAILPPAAPDGPHVAIRRFFKETLTIDKLKKFGSMTDLAAETLEACVVGKLNVIVAGGTGSGKTSMLNALSAFIPDGERVIVIEDNREVQFQRGHVLSLEARPPDARGKGAVTIRDLFKASLRMRPDRLVVGEIRGGEALEIIQAMTSGHGGCMGTLHATLPYDTLTRMETMCMMSDIEMPLQAMRVQIASALNIICQVARLQDGSRKVTHITEVTGFDTTTQKYQLNDIFVREYDGTDAEGKVISRLVPTGYIPHAAEHIEAHGGHLPPGLLEAARTKRSR